MTRSPITASTTLAAVVGSPVRHSLSPVIHNRAFAETGLDWVYVALEVAPGTSRAAFEGARALGIAGLSITTPHKDDAWEVAHERSPAAERMGAVNCLHLVNGRFVGHNTDGDGFVDSIRHAGFDPSGCRIAVLGAGGAARSVIEALARAEASEVLVVNRSVDRAERAAVLGDGRARVASVAEVSSCELVVNATSIGLGSNELPLDPSVLRPTQWVADLVYHPLETALLGAARALGCRVIDGLGMLVFQAARQFTIWTGTAAPIEAMRGAAIEELERRRG